MGSLKDFKGWPTFLATALQGLINVKVCSISMAQTGTHHTILFPLKYFKLRDLCRILHCMLCSNIQLSFDGESTYNLWHVSGIIFVLSSTCYTSKNHHIWFLIHILTCTYSLVPLVSSTLLVEAIKAHFFSRYSTAKCHFLPHQR